MRYSAKKVLKTAPPVKVAGDHRMAHKTADSQPLPRERLGLGLNGGKPPPPKSSHSDNAITTVPRK